MSDTSNADLVAAYTLDLFENYAIYATAALVCFEHLLTLKYEADFLRTRKVSAATWIFLSNRYLLLGFVLSTVIPYSPQSCNNTFVVNFLDFLTDTMQDVPIHAFTIIRSLALLQVHSWKLVTTWVLVALGLLLFATNTYGDFSQTWAYVNDPVLGSSCFQVGFSASTDIMQRLNVVGAVCGIASAAAALLITLYRTAQQVRQATSLRLATTLSEVLLRDGSLFFLLILFDNMLSVIPATNNIVLASPAGTVLDQLLDILPSLLLSRFIINLRQIDASARVLSDSRHASRVSTLNFRVPTLGRVVDNLGESMDFVEYSVGDDGQEEGECECQCEGVGTRDCDVNTLAEEQDRQPEGADLPRDIGARNATHDLANGAGMMYEALRLGRTPPV